MDGTSQDQGTYEFIDRKLEDFVARNLNSGSRLFRSGNKRQDFLQVREKISAVVLTGDAPPKAFALLKSELLEPMFGSQSQETRWLLDDIDPSAVMALGAAKWARYIRESPSIFGPYANHEVWRDPRGISEH